MTLPLNKKQKQLVEKSMDLVPIMIRSMTRTAAYVTEEEQQELCQIGYLALCRSAVGFEEGRSFQPYAKTIIRHAIFDYWRKIARDRSMLCSLDEASSEDEHLHLFEIRNYTLVSRTRAGCVQVHTGNGRLRKQALDVILYLLRTKTAIA